MGYISNRMSINADKAYKKGLLPRSKITISMLREKGWTYSAAFFNWLCKYRYIMPKEYHHTTPMRVITPFYDLNSLAFIINSYDLSSLYAIYLNKRTVRDVLNSKGVKYVRVKIGRKVLGTQKDVCLDCVKYNKLYWWSENLCFKSNTSEVMLVDSFTKGRIKHWSNPNKKKIERQILIWKSYYKEPK